MSWFQALAGAGQNFVRAGEQYKQEQDILKESQGRGKALQNAFKGLEELGVVPEGMAEKFKQLQESTAPREFIGVVDQASKEFSTLVQGGIHMQRIKAEQDERERLARAMRSIGATVGPTETGVSSGARFGGIATAQPRQASLQEMIQRIPTAGLEPGQAAALMNAMVNAQEAQTPKPVKGLEPTADMQNITALIQSELASGKLTPDRIPARQAELMQGRLAKVEQPSVPDPLVGQIYGDISKARTESVTPAIKALEAYGAIGDVSKDIISGVGAKPELFLKKIGAAFGIKASDIANTEILRGAIAVPVANIIKNFGAGTGLSDADREYALQAAGGQISMEPESIRRLLELGRIAAQNVVASYNEQLDSSFPEDSQDARFKQARNALLLPKAYRGMKATQAPAQAPRGPVLPPGWTRQ